MVTELDSGSSGPGLSPGLGHCVVDNVDIVLCSLLSQCLSPVHPGV